MWKEVHRSYPSPHARYLVIRNGTVFTATPCYGLHDPWWVVKTMEGEACADGPKRRIVRRRRAPDCRGSGNAR